MLSSASSVPGIRLKMNGTKTKTSDIDTPPNTPQLTFRDALML
jgi:hypothetical protein